MTPLEGPADPAPQSQPGAAAAASPRHGPDAPSELLLAWAIAIALVYGAWRWLPEAAAPFAAALAWIGVAVGAHVLGGRRLADMGLAAFRPARTVRFVAIYAATFLPAYAVLYFGWLGFEGFRLPGMDVPIVAFAGNLAFAAAPEEVFFRGFVQPRLALGAGPVRTVRIAGIPLSRPGVIAAALFAVTHVVFLADPVSPAAAERLTTFFPGLLFGALRDETGDVAAPIAFHALCNTWLATLDQGFRM